MTKKLERQFSEIQTEYEAIQEMVANKAEDEVIQEQMTRLEAKQADLKKTLLHVIVLCKRREELHAYYPGRVHQRPHKSTSREQGGENSLRSIRNSIIKLKRTVFS
jgi:hypothetical protein